MKYPIRLEYVLIEKDENYSIDGARHTAIRGRCKLADGLIVTSMVIRDPLPAGMPDEEIAKFEAFERTGIIDSLMLKINQTKA